MTFDEIFSDSPDGVVCIDGEFEMLKAEHAQPCWSCQTPTHFIDIYFEAPLCSKECAEKKWQEFRKASSE